MLFVVAALAGVEVGEAFPGFSVLNILGEPIEIEFPSTGHYTVVEAIRSVEW